VTAGERGNVQHPNFTVRVDRAPQNGPGRDYVSEPPDVRSGRDIGSGQVPEAQELDQVRAMRGYRGPRSPVRAGGPPHQPLVYQPQRDRRPRPGAVRYRRHTIRALSHIGTRLSHMVNPDMWTRFSMWTKIPYGWLQGDVTVK
jgi:hypothetical protein